MGRYKTTSLLIPGDFPPIVSGIATYFYEIWRYFPVKDNLILAPDTEGAEEWDRVHQLHVIRKRVPAGNSMKDKLIKGLLYAFWGLYLFRRYRFRVLHCGQVLSSGFCGWLLNLVFSVPYVIYVYGSETYRFGSNPLLLRAIKAFISRAKWIVPNSQFTRDEFLALGIAREKFKIVTPGVDTERFKPSGRNDKLEQKYSLTGKFVLLTVARLDERKGHDVVIEAIEILKKKHADIHYLIVGKGRERERLERLVKDRGVDSQVTFCGYVSDEDLPEYYNLCDLFVLLNRQTAEDKSLQGDYEGFGIVFLEASACGKPVLAGDFGGIRDAVEDGKSGFIIDGRNPEEAARYISRFYHDRELAQKMGRYGRERVVKKFRWELVSRRIWELNRMR